jgi:protein-S-isoprenylcysteine O-methyltransferase Ste14
VPIARQTTNWTIREEILSVSHQRTNIVLRSLVWLGALSWWVYLRKPAGSTPLDVRRGLSALAGVVLIGAGAALYAWAARTLASSVPSAVAPPAVLLMRGPYRYVRNPLYLAVAAVFVGVSTLYAPWGARDVLGAGLLAMLIHVFVAYREEPATRRRVGPAYDQYRARVPRWVPRYSRARD